MTMQAIHLTRANREKILQTGADITAGALDTMTEEYDYSFGEPLIFVPVFETAGSTRDSWATIPPESFDIYFEPADMFKMRTEFVQVFHKM